MLTPKQERFVGEYLIDLNATQAAIRAGYSPRTADKKAASWVGKGRVSEAIKSAQEARSEKAGITAEWVLQRLKTEAERQGAGAGHAARVRALELIGKHVGMFIDRVSVETPSRLVIVEEIVDADPQNAGSESLK